MNNERAEIVLWSGVVEEKAIEMGPYGYFFDDNAYPAFTSYDRLARMIINNLSQGGQPVEIVIRPVGSE